MILNILDKIRLNSVHVFILISILIAAAYLRFKGLSVQGFSDSDEFASYKFLVHDLDTYILKGVSGSMWGRPFGFFLAKLSMAVFGESPYGFLLRSAIAGILSIVVIYRVGEKYLKPNVGLFAAAMMSTAFTFVYYSKNMKQVSTAIFFGVLATWALLALLESFSKKRFILLGLALGAMMTTHPNTLPMVAVYLLIVASYVLKDYYTHRKHTVLLESISAPAIVLLFMLVCELFFLVIRFLFPFWEISGRVGYLTNLLYHANLVQENIPSFKFYLGIFKYNGWLYLYFVFAACFLVFANVFNFRRYGMPLVFAFWGPILIYVFSENIVAVQRNIVLTLVPATLLFGVACVSLYESLTYWAKVSFAGVIRQLLLMFFILSVVLYGFSNSARFLRPVSAAQQIQDYIDGGLASFPRASKSLYFWHDYYFKDHELFVDNWDDVFRNFLNNRAEYLVRLIPSFTNFDFGTNYARPYKEYANLNSNGTDGFYGVYDFRKQAEIFQEKYGLTKIPVSPDCKRMINLTKMLQNNLAQWYQKTTKVNVSIPENADLMIIYGRVPLSYEKLDTLSVAIGDDQELLAYDLEHYQPLSGDELEAHVKRQSIFSVWKVPKDIRKELVVSMMLVTNSEDELGKKVRLEDFEVAFYTVNQLGESFLSDVRELKYDIKISDNYNLELARFDTDNTLCPYIGANEKRYELDFAPTIRIPSKDFLPGKIYRVNFSGRTNYLGPGRLTAISRYRGQVQVLFVEWFWAPILLSYSKDFLSPMRSEMIEFHFGIGYDTKKRGKYKVGDLNIELIR